MIIKHDAVDPIEFDGLKIVDYTARLEGNSSLAEITVPVGVAHRVSWSRRSDKYYYVVNGDLAFTVGDESERLTAGDVCIVPQGERFSYANAGSSDAVVILVHTPSFQLECEAFEE